MMALAACFFPDPILPGRLPMTQPLVSRSLPDASVGELPPGRPSLVVEMTE